MGFRIANGRPTIVTEDSYEETTDLLRALLGVSALSVLGSLLIGPLLGVTVVGGVIAALSFLLEVEDGSGTIETTDTGERLPTDG